MAKRAKREKSGTHRNGEEEPFAFDPFITRFFRRKCLEEKEKRKEKKKMMIRLRDWFP
jgi:hypothetical protein